MAGGDGATVRVIAGASHGVQGAMQREATEPLYLDLHLEAGARFEQPLPPMPTTPLSTSTGGDLAIGHRRAPPAHGHPGQHPGSDGVVLHGRAPKGARAILMAGRRWANPLPSTAPS
jgi:redox-sensitive bicupin YhaK (pirin superfamily)